MILLERILEQQTRRQHLLSLQRFIFEDAYNGGEGWTGPNPVDPLTRTEIMNDELVRKQFVS